MLGQHVPGGAGAVRPSSQVTARHGTTEQLRLVSARVLSPASVKGAAMTSSSAAVTSRGHWVRLGQHMPGGRGAMAWEAGQRSTRHRTSEQLVLEHWSARGQHSDTGMGASSPVGQNSGTQVTWSH